MTSSQGTHQQASDQTSENSKPKTTRLKKEARRVQLLEVAAQLFAESSYGGVTTAALAKAAGVTEPVLYQHFQGKDELYHEVLQEACRRTLEAWRKILDEAPSPLAGVVGVARSQFRVMSDLWVFYKLHVRAVAEAGDEAVRKILCENDESYHSFIQQALERAKEAGEIRPEINTSDVAWFVMSQGLMLNVCKQIGNTKLEQSGYLENLIKTTLAGVSVGAPVIGPNSGQ